MRQVLAIHRHGSFVKAARDVGVAQPTLSKSISRLEDELGFKLFERSGSGAQATPMGALLVARAEKIIAQADRLSRDLEHLALGEIGEVRIGFGPAMRPMFLPGFAEALATRYRRLKLQLSVDRRDRLVADLQGGALDLVIMARSPELDGQDLVTIEIMREPLVAVASPTHPLASLKHLSAEEFLRYPNASSALTSLSASALLGGQAPASGQESLIVCDDDSTLKLLAMRGLTTLVSHQHAVQPELDLGYLVRLPLTLNPTASIMAVMTSAASHSPLFRAIVALAERTGRSLTHHEI